MKEGMCLAEDVELEDIIWVDKEKGYCEVLEIFHVINNAIVFVLIQTGGGEPKIYDENKKFHKRYSKNKKLQLFI